MYLTSSPIELATLLSEVQSPSHGAVVTFLGVVRDHQDGRAVVELDYSAYPEMAEAEAGRIAREAESRWPCSVALCHRTGRLVVGDIAVAIAAASAHRESAFAACRYVIEEVKRRVPIWKREYFADGTVEWVGGGEAGKGGSGEGTQRRDGDARPGVTTRRQSSKRT